MRKIRKHIGIHDIKEIKSIQETTSFEYIEDIEAVDSLPGQQLYRVVLTDTYIEDKKRFDII